MTPDDFIRAARVPEFVLPQSRGLWTIERNDARDLPFVGFDDYTLLRRVSHRSLHLEGAGEIVMEDSAQELRKHLPIWMASHGRILKTGLGLGCVVRGLLASPAVEHITCIEIDGAVIDMIGPEFAGEARVEIIHADALEWVPPPGAVWDFAWHDIWTDGDEHLQLLHARLACKFDRYVKSAQGAWAFPRLAKRQLRRKSTRPERWIG